jgi:hypothetical protein
MNTVYGFRCAGLLTRFVLWAGRRPDQTGLPARKGEPGPRDSRRPVRGRRAPTAPAATSSTSRALMRSISRRPAIGPRGPVQATLWAGSWPTEEKALVQPHWRVGSLHPTHPNPPEFPKRRHQRLSASRPPVCRQRCGVADSVKEKTNHCVHRNDWTGRRGLAGAGNSLPDQTVLRRSLCFSSSPDQKKRAPSSRRHLLNQGTGQR